MKTNLMNETYARLDEQGQLNYFKGLAFISNPNAELLKSAGYLPVRLSPAPSPYHAAVWEEEEGFLVQDWVPMPLDEARELKKQEIEQCKEEALNTSTRVTVSDLGWDAVYDSNAILNLLGLLSMQLESTYIDADDQVHELSQQDLLKVSAAIQNYRSSIYARKLELFALCDAAQNHQELMEISW